MNYKKTGELWSATTYLASSAGELILVAKERRKRTKKYAQLLLVLFDD